MMKASIKCRDEEKPLLRAKIPLKILGLPFQSAVSAGDFKDWSITLGTFFNSGPMLKFTTRPNDPKSPFSFVFKTGIGHFGSPIDSPFTMSAEFNLIGDRNPTFFVHFRPVFGNFSLKKSLSSDLVALNSIERVEGADHTLPHEYFNGNGFVPSPVDSRAAAKLLFERIVKGTELSARTAVPLLDYAVLNFRWVLRVPPQDELDTVVVRSKRDPKLPLLVMNKIGIEQAKPKAEIVAAPKTKHEKAMEAYLYIRKQLEIVQAEHGLLNKALNDLKLDIAAGRLNFMADKHSADRRSVYEKKQCPEMSGFGGGADQAKKL